MRSSRRVPRLSSVTHDRRGDTHGDTGLSPGCPPLTPAMSLVVSLCALQTLHVVNGWPRTEKERAMKLYVDTNGKKVTVTKDPIAKTDGQTDRQKTERGTGRLMWSTQVFVLDDDGGEVITITTAGEKPNVKVGQELAVSKLEALPWSTNGRSGVAFRAVEIKAAGLTSVKTG